MAPGSVVLALSLRCLGLGLGVGVGLGYPKTYSLKGNQCTEFYVLRRGGSRLEWLEQLGFVPSLSLTLFISKSVNTS